MNVLSLFWWIEWGRAALDFLGITPDSYFSAEVDPYPIKISSANYPDIIHLGDVEQVEYDWDTLYCPWEYHGSDMREFPMKFDLLLGWPPCQDLSIAKKNGKWLEWEKSKLFYEFVRILNEVKPKYFLMENIASMKRADEAKITEILWVSPIIINSNLVSAQNRKRLYWVGKLNESWTYDTLDIPQPEDEWIFLRDILEDIPMDDERWKPIPEKYLTEEFIKKITDAREKSLTITASYAKKNIQNYMEKGDGQVVLWIAHRNRGEWKQPECNFTEKENSLTTVQTDSEVLWVFQIPRGKNNGNIHAKKSPTVNAKEFEHNNKIVAQNNMMYVWRKLTVRECARLQTLPESFIFPVSDSRAYKAIGNGWTVNVITHILSFIVKKR